jgi:hypothetical protein
MSPFYLGRRLILFVGHKKYPTTAADRAGAVPRSNRPDAETAALPGLTQGPAADDYACAAAKVAPFAPPGRERRKSWPGAFDCYYRRVRLHACRVNLVEMGVSLIRRHPTTVQFASHLDA